MPAMLDLERIDETRRLLGEERFLGFLGEFGAEMDELAGWLAASPAAAPEAIVAGCHRLASSAGVFGATDLRRALLAAEAAARGPAQVGLEALGLEVARCWAETRDAFGALPPP